MPTPESKPAEQIRDAMSRDTLGRPEERKPVLVVKWRSVKSLVKRLFGK